ARSSSGLGCSPLKAEISGSNPLRATRSLIELCQDRIVAKSSAEPKPRASIKSSRALQEARRQLAICRAFSISSVPNAGVVAEYFVTAVVGLSNLKTCLVQHRLEFLTIGTEFGLDVSFELFPRPAVLRVFRSCV